MFYTQSDIDRADHLRKDADALQRMRKLDSTRLVPVCDGASLVSTDTAVALLLPSQPVDAAHEVFLGEDEHRAYFAVDISQLAVDKKEALLATAVDIEGQPHHGEFKDLRTAGPLLPHHEGSLLAYARGLIFWNDHTRHCIRCGNLLLSSGGGHIKMCSQCDHIAFPRTDPAVIMLVINEREGAPDQCLLGRSPAWPDGVFSTLAGFVEPGESLEMAVQREVLEEASIHTDDIRYVASQPWPFPRSIMLGFKARATSTQIRCDPTELAEAHWFTREQLRDFGSWADSGDGFKLPRTDSIARHLIDQWINA